MTYALSQPLQAAIYQHLAADGGVSGLVGTHIYDAPLPLETAQDVPDYIILGSETVRDKSSKTATGAVHDLNIDVVSQADGYQSSKAVAGAICDALLDAALPMARGKVIYLRFLKARADAGRPPARRKITLQFRAFVEDV